MPSPIATPSSPIAGLSTACYGQGASRHAPVPVPTNPPQAGGHGHHVCPGARGLASPTHHVLSRACCFSCSSRFRLSTSTFSSMFYGAGRRSVGCSHACLDTPAPLPMEMKQKWHGGPPCHGRALGEWHR